LADYSSYSAVFYILTILYGFLPTTSNAVEHQQRARKSPTHREKDRRLKILPQSLADAIEKDTSLIRRAKNHIDRLLKENQGAATGDIMEWCNILDSYSIRRLARFFTSSSERANRLRQSNPIFAVLNDDERAQICFSTYSIPNLCKGFSTYKIANA
jgi:hypothetical protein